MIIIRFLTEHSGNQAKINVLELMCAHSQSSIVLMTFALDPFCQHSKIKARVTQNWGGLEMESQDRSKTVGIAGAHF